MSFKGGGNVLNEGAKILGIGGKKEKPSGPSPEDIERAKDVVRQAKMTDLLEKLQQAANGAEVRRESKEVKNRGERRLIQSSAFHFKFDSAGSDLSDNKTDAEMAMLARCSGHQYKVIAGEQPEQQSKSDTVLVGFKILGLLNETEAGKPKVQIVVPEFEDGSLFNGPQLVRDKLQELIELYLPDAEIDGPRRWEVKTLTLVNDTPEPIVVWAQAEIRHVEDFKISWRTAPNVIGTDDAYRITLAPGEKRLMPAVEATNPDPSASLQVGEEKPIEARWVHLWAESDNGQTWNEYETKKLWLVAKNPKMSGERSYHAQQIQTYTYTFKPNPKPGVFSERLVAVKNELKEPLAVQLEYRTASSAKERWQRLPEFQLAAGQELPIRDESGRRVRAAHLRVAAESENVRYSKSEPLPIVEEQYGRRQYVAPQIGAYTHRFVAPKPTLPVVSKPSGGKPK